MHQIRNFSSSRDVLDYAFYLKDFALASGVTGISLRLERYFRSAWTTSSEALGELRIALLEIKPLVAKQLTSEVKTLDSAIRTIDAVLGNAYRGG